MHAKYVSATRHSDPFTLCVTIDFYSFTRTVSWLRKATLHAKYPPAWLRDFALPSYKQKLPSWPGRAHRTTCFLFTFFQPDSLLSTSFSSRFSLHLLFCAYKIHASDHILRFPPKRTLIKHHHLANASCPPAADISALCPPQTRHSHLSSQKETHTSFTHLMADQVHGANLLQLSRSQQKLYTKRNNPSLSHLNIQITECKPVQAPPWATSQTISCHYRT